MKIKHLLMSSLIIVSSLSFSQTTISKAILNVTLKSGYAFSDSKNMDVSLIQKYNLYEKDTAYFINIQIRNFDSEKTGASVGWSYGLGLGVSSNYSIKKENEYINIYKETYNKIQNCLSTSYFFIKNNVDKSKNKITATCGDDILTFWAEYEPGKNPKYFFRLADAVYPLLDEDFNKVMVLFSTAQRYFGIQP